MGTVKNAKHPASLREESQLVNEGRKLRITYQIIIKIWQPSDKIRITYQCSLKKTKKTLKPSLSKVSITTTYGNGGTTSIQLVVFIQLLYRLGCFAIKW